MSAESRTRRCHPRAKGGETMQVFWRIATTVSIVVTVVSVVSASITSLAGSVPAWPQWGQNPQHSGTAVAAGQGVNLPLPDLTFHPVRPQEISPPIKFWADYIAPPTPR